MNKKTSIIIVALMISFSFLPLIGNADIEDPLPQECVDLAGVINTTSLQLQAKALALHQAVVQRRAICGQDECTDEWEWLLPCFLALDAASTGVVIATARLIEPPYWQSYLALQAAIAAWYTAYSAYLSALENYNKCMNSCRIITEAVALLKEQTLTLHYLLTMRTSYYNQIGCANAG
ncbi:MAG: hypothetical protein GC154_07615 [bacterium]|nr:hypothetical protein [bacterium]